MIHYTLEARVSGVCMCARILSAGATRFIARHVLQITRAGARLALGWRSF